MVFIRICCFLIIQYSTIAQSTGVIDCSFEAGFCGWQNDISGNLSWHLWNKSSPLGRTSLPRTDHTLRDENGHFAFIRGIEATIPSWRASFRSPSFTIKNVGRLTFWYYMRGHGVGDLQVTLLHSGSANNVFHVTGRQSSNWKEAEIFLSKGTYQITMEATARLHYDSDLAIDDILLTTDYYRSTTMPSTTPKATMLPFSCKFDNGLCGYEVPPSSYSPVTWDRVDAKTVQGVGGDNAKRSGYYMSLVEKRPNGKIGDKSEMISPPLRSSTNACLRMAYILPNAESGTISVYQKSLSSGLWNLLKEISGYKGNSWRSTLVDVPKSTDNYQIVIEGTFSGVRGSLIGIDDVQIEEGHCIKPTLPPFTSSNTASCSYPSQTVIPSLTCSFDDDLCGYRVDNGGLKWKRAQGSYGSAVWISNIDSDHTYANDATARKKSFAVIDVEDYSASFGSVGSMKTFPLNNSICIEFWYILKNRGSNLELVFESSDGLQKQIWRASGSATNWTMGAMLVDSISDFKIVFQSIKQNANGYAAVDDITVYQVLETESTTVLSSTVQNTVFTSAKKPPTSSDKLKRTTGKPHPTTTIHHSVVATSAKKMTTASDKLKHTSVKLQPTTSKRFTLPQKITSAVLFSLVPTSAKKSTPFTNKLKYTSVKLQQTTPKRVISPLLPKITTLDVSKSTIKYEIKTSWKPKFTTSSNEIISKDKEVNDNKSNGSTIAVGVIVPAVCVVLILCISLYFYKKHKIHSTNDSEIATELGSLGTFKPMENNYVNQTILPSDDKHDIVNNVTYMSNGHVVNGGHVANGGQLSNGHIPESITES